GRRVPRAAPGLRREGPQAAPRAVRQRALQLPLGRAGAALHADERRRAGRAPARLADLAPFDQADRLPGDEASLLRALLFPARNLPERRLRRAALRAGEDRARIAAMIHQGADRDLLLKPDVCVVGSGPGGAMVASRLASAG